MKTRWESKQEIIQYGTGMADTHIPLLPSLRQRNFLCTWTNAAGNIIADCSSAHPPVRQTNVSRDYLAITLNLPKQIKKWGSPQK